MSVKGVVSHHQIGAHRGDTSAAIDSAEYDAVVDVDGDIASHYTCRVGIFRESASATEDVAIDGRRTRRADDDIRVRVACLTDGDRTTDIGFHIAQDMSVLTSAKGGAEDAGIA